MEHARLGHLARDTTTVDGSIAVEHPGHLSCVWDKNLLHFASSTHVRESLNVMMLNPLEL